MDSTGDRQLNAGLTLDSPLFLYDQFSVSWNSNVKFNKREAGARASSLNYSIPYGYWRLFVGASRSTYRQTVVGFEEPIVYSGRSTQVETGVRVVPYRGTRHKGGLSAKVFRKRASSAINETDIEVQRRHVVGYELGYSHRHYVGLAVLDAGFGLRATLPSHSDATGFLFDDPSWNGRSTILLASAGVYLPFQIQEQALAYQANSLRNDKHEATAGVIAARSVENASAKIDVAGDSVIRSASLKNLNDHYESELTDVSRENKAYYIPDQTTMMMPAEDAWFCRVVQVNARKISIGWVMMDVSSFCCLQIAIPIRDTARPLIIHLKSAQGFRKKETWSGWPCRLELLHGILRRYR
jgi:Haemolysin secretion/activation protein ShlB/FhaC/HecB